MPPRQLSLSISELDGPTEIREAWLVALADQYLLVYDPAAGEFALAEAGGSVDATDIGVRGDVVGTFLAA